jgi:hypothetical protein
MHQDEAPFRAELVAAFRRERQRSAVYGDARDCRTFVDGEVAMGGVAPTLDDVRTGDVSMITSGG